MKIIRGKTNVNFLGMRRIALAFSVFLIVVGLASVFSRGLNLGIDFTGGTVVEIGFDEAVEISHVRERLAAGGFGKAVVQYFGTARDLMVRLPVQADVASAELSDQVMKLLRDARGETLAPEQRPGRDQTCVIKGESGACTVQMRRVEFVGPQVGKELTEKGGLAMLYAMALIMVYVALRFEWRFSMGAIAALIHDVVITVGVFSILQLEFSLTVMAAILAVIGYSLNDTIVVFDRIRENFRRIRKGGTVEIMNSAINQTLPRTLLTSVTTMLVLLALFFLGGEVIRGFSIALIIGVVIGTYSSIFVASPLVLMLGLSREDMLLPKKEGADVTP
ncbi:MAG: protein translocase subunit SecF [Gammaproteobacteria bacterium]|jgi:preprotein translocase subunit SecF|nr:protein translocase subunit SecF [Gammaproteobacteria bacterium]